jgi:hypothetical protein
MFHTRYTGSEPLVYQRNKDRTHRTDHISQQCRKDDHFTPHQPPTSSCLRYVKDREGNSLNFFLIYSVRQSDGDGKRCYVIQSGNTILSIMVLTIHNFVYLICNVLYARRWTYCNVHCDWSIVIDSATSRNCAQMIEIADRERETEGDIRRQVLISGSEGRIVATSMSKTSRLQEPYLKN